MNNFSQTLVKLLFLSIIMITISSCIDRSSDEKQSLQAAKVYLEKRDLGAASLELRNVLLANAQNAEARYLLAGINLETGDIESAKKEYKRAADAGWNADEIEIGNSKVLIAQFKFRQLIDDITIKDNWPTSSRADLLGLYAIAEASTGNIEQAKATLASGIKLQADAFQVLKSTAIFQLIDKDYPQTLNTIDQALQSYPDNIELLLLKAKTEELQKQFSDAANTYRHIVNNDPTTVMTSNNLQARIGLARMAIIEKNYDEAQQTLNALLKLNSNNPDAVFLSTLLAFERKDYQQAEEQMQKIMDITAEHAPSILLMGKIKYALENYEQAAFHLENYLNKAPDDVSAQKLLASSYLALGKHELASKTLEPALNKNPGDADLAGLMSQLNINRDDTGASIKELKKSIEASPDNADLHERLALSYIIAGETDNAVVTLERYGQIKNDSNKADNLIIMAYVSGGKFEQAINTAEKMLSRSPQDTEVLTLLGTLHVSNSNNDQGRKYYGQALQLDKDFVTAKIGLAKIEGIEGNYAKAASIYNELIDAGQGGTAPMLALAQIAEQQGQTDDMVRWLEKARAAAPDEVSPRFSLARHYYKNQQYARADLLAQEALKISPSDANLLALHGQILIAQERYNKALSPLNSLVEKQPDSAAARVMLAQTYMRLGIDGNARTHLGKALEIQPDNISALGLMAQMELNSGAAEKSMSYASKIQALQPEFYYGYKLEGDAWMLKQDKDRARVAYQAAWEKQNSAELAIMLYKTSNTSTDFDQAITPLISWLKQQPDDTRTRAYLAEAYQQVQQNKKAINEYEIILQKSADDISAMNNLAWLYHLTNNPKALPLAQSAYQKTNGDNPYIRDTYGWLLVKDGQYENGEKILQQALEQLPDNTDVQYHYAVAAIKSGKKADGISLLEKLLADSKDFDGRDDAQQLLNVHKNTN